MKLLSSKVLGGLAACILTLPLMASSVTYTYTGSDFQVVTGPYTLTDFVSGDFTLASALGANLVDDSLTPASYSFSDGVQTITSANPPPDVTFDISTDASGNINGWFINLESPSGPFFQISTETTPNQEDLGATSSGEGYNFFVEGTWAESGGGSPVPEPGNLGLAALGLVAIGLVRRKLNQRNHPIN